MIKTDIAIVIGEFPAISETFVLDQIVAICENGYDITIYAKNPRNEKFVHNEVNKYNLIQKSKYLYKEKDAFSLFFNFIKAFLLCVKIKEKRICLYKIILRIFKYKEKSIKMIFRLSQISMHHDIYYIHFGNNSEIIAELKKLGYIKGEIVTVFHGNDVTLALRNKINYNTLFEQGYLMLSISEYWARKLIELGCSQDKIKVHYLGVKVANRIVEKIDNKKIQILTIGRLTEKKGMIYALQAIKILVDMGIKNIHYSIIGGGESQVESALETFVNDNNLEEYITFLGLRTRAEVQKSFFNTDIFLLPSITAKNGDMEGIPVVIMEAATYGLPIVSSYHSGIPELVIHQKTGLLADEKNTTQIVACLEKLINDKEYRKKLGNNAYEKVKNEFNKSIQNKKLLELLTNISHR